MDIANFIFTYLKNKLPSINWSIGSTVRELIATPMVTVAESANEILNNQVNAVSLNTLINNPEEYEEVINTTFEELNLEENNSVESAGTVTILTTTNQVSPIVQGTSFYVDTLRVETTHTVAPMLVPDNSEESTQIRQLGYKSYAFDVPVRAIDYTTFISEDTSMTWDGAPNYVYDVVVSKAISGGRSAITLEDKISKIKDYIAPTVLSLSDGVTKVLRQNLPDIVVDTAYDKVNSNDTAYLYVKTVKAPGYEMVKVTGERTDNVYVVNTKILGVIDVIEAYKDSEQISFEQLQVDNNNIYCKLQHDSENATEEFALKVYKMPDFDIIQDFINGYTAGSPFNLEVKAPAVFSVSLDFDYTGNILNTYDIGNICNMVQSQGLSKEIKDTRIEAILTASGASLQGPCTYTLYTHTGSCYKQRYSTALYYTSASAVYALYMNTNEVYAHHV